MLLFVIKFLQSSGFDGLWFYRTQILQTVWYIRSQISRNIYNNETLQLPAMLTGQSNSPTEKIKRLQNENVFNRQNCKMFPSKHIFSALIICNIRSRYQYKHMWLPACQFNLKSPRFDDYDKILVEKVVKFSISETLNRFYFGNFRRQNSCQDISK